MKKQGKLKAVIRLSLYFMKQYQWRYLFSIVLAILAPGVGAFMPFVISRATKELVANVKDMRAGIPGAGVNFDYIGRIILLLILITVVRQIFHYLSAYTLTGAVQHSFRDLRTEISRKMNRLPVSYFDTQKQGTVLSCITNDVDAVANAMQQSLMPVISSITSIVMYFGFMMFISWKLGLLVMLLVPATFFLSRFFMKKSQDSFLDMQNKLADLNGYIQERYMGFTLVKLYNNEQKSIDEFGTIVGNLNQAGFRASFTSALLTPFIELLVNMVYVIMVLLSGMAVFAGMNIGDMQAFVQYIWQIYDPLSQMTQLSPAIQSAVASMERIMNFLDEPEEDQEEEKRSQMELEKVKGDVRFNHVAFSYHESRPLIQDLSFSAKQGETIAIVGATGAGKTTIINLLMRFYDISAGEIEIDGENIYTLKRGESRSLFGMVLQDAWLYHASIYDNIRFGRLDASKFEVVEAAKTANVHHFIKTLPESYNTMINEDTSNISMGQKQLITIARAILSDPRILILDEATSSVDTRLEMLIQKAMKKATEGRTSFVIAHRLSTIRDADLILVLDNGDIVEKGTHEELLSQSGVYEKLYNSQFAEE